MSEQQKFTTIYGNLKRALKLKSRMLALINAYLLGQFMNDLLVDSKQIIYQQQMTRHYSQLSKLTYDVFEPCPEQILKTKIISVATIKDLK